MIKIKLGDLVDSTETLQKLSQKELKARLALSIARLLKEAEREIQYFNDTRMNLIRKYGTKDENGELITDDRGNCKIDDANLTEFSSELNDLIAVEVELNAGKIKIDLLENLDFTPGDMAVLEPFIETEENE